MLLFLLITCFPFILFIKSLALKPLPPPWANDMKLSFLWFWKILSLFHISELIKDTLSSCHLSLVPYNMSLMKNSPSSTVENVEETGEMSVLDLPELALECILERLPPAALCSTAAVCSSLRERCMSDHLWKKHMRQKWGRIIGPAAYREWQRYIALNADSNSPKQGKQRGLMRFLSLSWPFSLFRWRVDNGSKQRSFFPVDKIMGWYLALETGRFWFRAQVYNRENGHVGFMLSCYDAEVSYDCRTDTFQARYPPHGKRTATIENGVPWERLRAPPVDTAPHDLHISDCLNELRPENHIEIQWRRNKEFPYGWWYGVVGHLESCDGNENNCCCHNSDTVVLVFNQYTTDSRWRCTTINRKDHREEGNEADGFYGGIRKLKNEDEISTWKQLWPTEVLE